MLVVREAFRDDSDSIWTILEPVIRAGETYVLRRDLSRDAALAYWFANGNTVFVANDKGNVVRHNGTTSRSIPAPGHRVHGRLRDVSTAVRSDLRRSRDRGEDIVFAPSGIPGLGPQTSPVVRVPLGGESADRLRCCILSEGDGHGPSILFLVLVSTAMTP